VPAFAPAFADRPLAIRGLFEAHLTVDTDRRADFEALCGELDVDCVGIELPDGVHRAQPMTASHHRGELAAVIGEVEALHARIVAAGFTIVRTKLEASASNEGVPPADDAGYFEFHVKVRVDPMRLDALARIARSSGGRLSRNDRHRDDLPQRFVTMRVYRATRTAAEAQLEALLAALDAAGFDRAGIAREYTLYDSRIELDAGWLEPPA
jgi:hypothetical protein